MSASVETPLVSSPAALGGVVLRPHRCSWRHTSARRLRPDPGLPALAWRSRRYRHWRRGAGNEQRDPPGVPDPAASIAGADDRAAVCGARGARRIVRSAGVPSAPVCPCGTSRGLESL